MKHNLIFTLIAVFAAAAVVMSLAPAPDGGLPKKEKHSGKSGQGGNSGQQRPGGNSSSGSHGGGSSHPTPPPAPATIPEIEMIYVSGGTFMMGTNDGEFDWYKPAHSETVSSFAIGKYEVTQKLWKAVMGTNPSRFKGDNLPVENVSWNQVQEFIRKLNAKTGKHYRLPTEAEWEFAARGGNRSRGYKYSGSNCIDEVAWYDGNSDESTHAVGTKSPNELGIYDMTGNVEEWTSDFMCNGYDNPRTGPKRVIRGESYRSWPGKTFIYSRGSYHPEDGNEDIGFRLTADVRQ